MTITFQTTPRADGLHTIDGPQLPLIQRNFHDVIVDEPDYAITQCQWCTAVATYTVARTGSMSGQRMIDGACTRHIAPWLTPGTAVHPDALAALSREADPCRS